LRKTAEITLKHGDIHPLYNSLELKEDDNLISLVFQYENYRALPKFFLKDQCLQVESGSASIVFNKKTGQTFLKAAQEHELSNLIEKNTPVYFTAFAFKEHIKQLLKEEKLLAFLKRIAINKNLTIKNFEEYLNYDGIMRIFLYGKFPPLHLLPFEKYSKIPFQVDEEFLNISKANDLWKNLTGHSSRLVKEKGETIAGFNEVYNWGRVIKHPSNLLNFLSYFQQKYETEVFISCHFNVEYLNKGVELIQSLHEGKEEKMWVKRLLKAAKEMRHIYSEQMMYYVADIGRMYQNIIDINQEYQLNFRGDIIEFHDLLANDYVRMINEKKDIPYKKEELVLEKKVNDYEFKLARDTHELIDIGSKMSICVGGYRHEALTKRCTIVTLSKKEEPLICIELNSVKKSFK
jgi:hypothetical protein